MWNKDKKDVIWDQVVELSFDCYCAGNLMISDLERPVRKKMVGIVSSLVNRVRRDLMIAELSPNKPPEFMDALKVLADLIAQLQLAKGLGFLDQKRFKRLHGRAAMLEVLLSGDNVYRPSTAA